MENDFSINIFFFKIHNYIINYDLIGKMYSQGPNAISFSKIDSVNGTHKKTLSYIYFGMNKLSLS
jgi:hypothetical protein